MNILEVKYNTMCISYVLNLPWSKLGGKTEKHQSNKAWIAKLYIKKSI